MGFCRRNRQSTSGPSSTRGSRNADGSELHEGIPGYCRLAAKTTASSCTVEAPGGRCQVLPWHLDRMLQERPPLDRKPSEDADDYFGSAYAYLYR
jgi:hypothetical protein